MNAAIDIINLFLFHCYLMLFLHEDVYLPATPYTRFTGDRVLIKDFLAAVRAKRKRQNAWHERLYT